MSAAVTARVDVAASVERAIRKLLLIKAITTINEDEDCIELSELVPEIKEAVDEAILELLPLVALHGMIDSNAHQHSIDITDTVAATGGA